MIFSFQGFFVLFSWDIQARLREAASLEKHVLLMKLRDALESLRGRVAGRNKDDVEEAIAMVSLSSSILRSVLLFFGVFLKLWERWHKLVFQLSSVGGTNEEKPVKVHVLKKRPFSLSIISLQINE